MTTRVRIVEVIIPPTIAVPIGARVSAPAPRPMATGIMPAIVDNGAYLSLLPPFPVTGERGIDVDAILVRGDGEALADLLARARRAGVRIATRPVRPVYGEEKSGVRLYHALFVIPFVLLRALTSARLRAEMPATLPFLADDAEER